MRTITDRRGLLLTVLTLCISMNAYADQISFIYGGIKRINPNGAIGACEVGDTVYEGETIRLSQHAVCEIAFDDGNAYARLDKPGDYPLRELFGAEGQNQAVLDVQTRLALKWRHINRVLPKHSGTMVLPGIRGNMIRPEVAKLRPGLGKSTFAEPFLLAGPNGTAAAIWHSKYYRDQEISFAKIKPNQPPQISRLSNAKGESCWPWLEGDPDGYLYAAWEDGRDGGRREIYFKYSENGGNTWSQEIRLTDHGRGAYDPVLWASGENVILIWEDGRNGIYCRKSSDQGKSWLGEECLTNGQVSWPAINGIPENLWIAWVEKGKKDQAIYAMQSQNAGKSWGKQHEIVRGVKSLGEPALQSLGEKGVCVAWRDDRHGQSEIYSVVTLDGQIWQEEMRITQNEHYNEYPAINQTAEGMALVYYSPTYDWNYSWITTSPDQGITWSEPIRIPGITNNVEKAFFVTSFKLPWDRSIYSNHDMTFKINDRVIGKLENTLPEGQCLFELDPRILKYSSFGQAQNKVEINTRRLNGGNYHINNGLKVVQSMARQEMMVVASTQTEADTIAQSLLPELINHALPDIGVYANKINGLPEDRNQRGQIKLEVEVFNLGAGAAKNIEVYVAKGARGEGMLLSPRVRIDALSPQQSRKTNLIFSHAGGFYQAAVVAQLEGKDNDLENNAWMFRMGYEKKGMLQVHAEEGAVIVVQQQSSGEEKARFKSGDTIELPIGTYRVTAEGTKAHVRENVSITGGETKEIYFDIQGKLLVRAPGEYPIKIYRDAVLVKETKSNQKTELEPGFYKIEVNCGEQCTVRYLDVLIESRKLSEVSVKMGFIGVSSLGNYPAKLYYPDGTLFREVPGAEYVQVPEGLFQVRMKPAEFPEVNLGFVRIREGVHAKMRLTGFGQIGVSSVGRWDYTLYTLAGKKLLDISGSKLFCTIVPVGTYTLKVKPEQYEEINMGRVTIMEDEVVKLKTPGFGQIGIESPGNWDYSLYKDGRKFMDIKGGQLTCTVVPAGTYQVKVNPTEYPEIDLGNLTINDNQTVKKKVPGFGWIGVESLGKWDAQLFYPDGREFRILKGDSLFYTVVPEGTYKVIIKPDPYPEKSLGNYVVKAYEKTRIKVKGYGQIGVESPGNWDSELFNLDGTKFCDIKGTDVYLKIVPVGKYIVKLKPDPYPIRDLGQIAVTDDTPARLKVGGYGFVALNPKGKYIAELIGVDGIKIREIRADSSLFAIVPVGEYTVLIEGKRVGKVNVLENVKKRIETGYH